MRLLTYFLSDFVIRLVNQHLRIFEVKVLERVEDFTVLCEKLWRAISFIFTYIFKIAYILVDSIFINCLSY